MRKSSIIGGEFAINLERANKSDIIKEKGYFYSSGRSALYNILTYLHEKYKYKRILLPDYLCETIPEACLKAEYEIVFFNLNENLSIDYTSLESLYDRNSIVLIINYFGLIDCKEIINRLKSIDNKILVIQDDVQAYFDMFNDSEADFCFTSFRKTLPVVDGGWVKTSYENLPVYYTPNKFSQYKISGNHLKMFKDLECIEDDVYLNLLDIGEKMISSEYCTRMNVVTPSLYNRLDKKDISLARTNNAKYIKKGLETLQINPILPLNTECTPLFIPIRISNRNEVRKAMRENNIFCPVHWPVETFNGLKRGLEMARNELSLIIDQRYDEKDMIRILEVIDKYSKK